MTILKTHVLFSGFSFKFNACREGHYSPSATLCAPSNPPEQCLRAVGGTWRVPTTTVDRCFSFSKGVFSGSMWVFGGCKPFQIKIRNDCDQRSLNPAKHRTQIAACHCWKESIDAFLGKWLPICGCVKELTYPTSGKEKSSTQKCL